MSEGFKQKVTFTATLTVTTAGMDWTAAAEAVDDALYRGDKEAVNFTLDLLRVTRMEIVEEGR